MNARNRVFVFLGVLLIGSLTWYFLTGRHSADLQMIGTVDANEVQVSSKISGRIQKLLVDEGQDVTAGQLIAVIESDDLQAASAAANATAAGTTSKVAESVTTEQQTRGETSSAALNAEAQLKVAKATLAQAQSNYDHQQADTSRTTVLAEQGIMSVQAKDQSVTSLQAYRAAVAAARESVVAAEAALRQAHAHEMQASVAAHVVSESQSQAANAKAMANQAAVQLGYANVYAPVTGKVHVCVAREGEVVAAGAAIVTVMDLSQTWVYAPLPETQADAVKLNDHLQVAMPSGAKVDGVVIAKSALADFATQRDVNSRKRDIKTVQLKLLIANAGGQFVPGMTAEVYIPEGKLVKQ